MPLAQSTYSPKMGKIFSQYCRDVLAKIPILNILSLEFYVDTRLKCLGSTRE